MFSYFKSYTLDNLLVYHSWGFRLTLYPKNKKLISPFALAWYFLYLWIFEQNPTAPAALEILEFIFQTMNPTDLYSLDTLGDRSWKQSTLFSIESIANPQRTRFWKPQNSGVLDNEKCLIPTIKTQFNYSTSPLFQIDGQEVKDWEPLLLNPKVLEFSSVNLSNVKPIKLDHINEEED